MQEDVSFLSQKDANKYRLRAWFGALIFTLIPSLILLFSKGTFFGFIVLVPLTIWGTANIRFTIEVNISLKNCSLDHHFMNCWGREHIETINLKTAYGDYGRKYYRRGEYKGKLTLKDNSLPRKKLKFVEDDDGFSRVQLNQMIDLIKQCA